MMTGFYIRLMLRCSKKAWNNCTYLSFTFPNQRSSLFTSKALPLGPRPKSGSARYAKVKVTWEVWKERKGSEGEKIPMSFRMQSSLVHDDWNIWRKLYKLLLSFYRPISAEDFRYSVSAYCEWRSLNFLPKGHKIQRYQERIMIF